MRRKILIIEDNRELARLLEDHLKDHSFGVDWVSEGNAGLSRAESGDYDLIILDIMLPGLDGLEICRRLRYGNSGISILMLTSKSTELDRVLGLEIGADDYVTKPFSIRELLARIKAIFRRIEMNKAASEDRKLVLKAGDLTIDPGKRKVSKGDKEIRLTAREFDLLCYFARNPGRVYTRTQLLNDVWGYGHEGYEHTVNSHINRLRAKIEKDPSQPVHVLTVWGVGYKFMELER